MLRRTVERCRRNSGKRLRRELDMGYSAAWGDGTDTIYTLPYWNSYGFPENYIIAELITWTMSWAVAGLAMAKISKPAAA